jgi:hypothetical protein
MRLDAWLIAEGPVEKRSLAVWSTMLGLAAAACSSSSPATPDLSMTDRPPVLVSLTASPPTVPRKAQTTLNAVATDPDADPLTYAWTLPTGWSFADASKNALASVSIVAPDQPGQTGTVMLTVSDGRGGSTDGTVIVSTPADGGPLIASVSAIPPLVHRGDTINLAVSATDPEGLALTYAWNAPMGWTLTPSADGTTATLVTPTTTAQHVTVTVTATDTANKSATGSVLVGTADNLPPTIASLSTDATQVLPGGAIHALVSASDPDSDPLMYVWSVTDTAWQVTGSGTAVTVTAPQQNGASTTLTVVVSDGIGGSAQASVLLKTGTCGMGFSNCDGNDANGCETDTTTATNCGACGKACANGEVCDHGNTCRAPSTSCEAMIEAGTSLGDGIYYIKPPGAIKPYKVYCDMTTDGGGWTGFYAGLNGSTNGFDHFEANAADCPDPLNRCMIRVPASEVGGEIMATCGSAKVGFIPSNAIDDYFINGSPASWEPTAHARALSNGVDPKNDTWVWTGDGGSGFGFIIGDQSYANTFASTYPNDPGFNRCNGVFDTSSSIKLFYRSKVDHLQLTTDSVNQTPGQPFTLTVIAADVYGDPVPGYAGTVHFTATVGGVTLPVDYTFVPADGGQHDFSVTLAGSGVVTITATDTVRNVVTGSKKVNGANLGTANTPALSCKQILDAGASGGDGVYILNDTTHTFSTLCDMTTDGGGWTVFFTDLNGSPNVFDNFEYTNDDCPAPLTQCMRRIPAATSPEILASCGSAVAAFTPSEGARAYFAYGAQGQWEALNGARTVSGTPNLSFITLLWTGSGGNTGFIISDNVDVMDTFAASYNPNNLWDFCNGTPDTQSRVTLAYRNVVDHLEVSTVKLVDAGGPPFDVTVRAVGKNGKVVSEYLGTVHFTSSDGGATLPADYTFTGADGGVHTFSAGVTLAATSGSVTVTATDTVVPAFTGQTTINVGGLGSPSMPAGSCNAIVGAGNALGDGLYWLTDGVTPQQVFCEMTTDGGGWTLVLKADGQQTTFRYDQALWTNTATFNPTGTDFDQQQAKLATWNYVPFTQMLVKMQRTDQPGNINSLEFGATAASMNALMSPGTYVATTAGRAAWKAALPGSSLQFNCNREGFNNDPTNGAGWDRVRIGIVGNEQNNCGTPDSRLGVGGQYATCAGDANNAVGNVCGCGGDNGDQNLYAFSWVLVR